MATLVLTAVGTVIGGPVGGAIGAIIGQSADAMLFAPKAREGPRLGDLAVQTSSYGSAIPKVFGTMRVAGTVIWSTDLIERRATSGGGKGRPKSVDYSYAASFAVALSGRTASAVGRIWADGKLLRGAAGDFKSRTGFRFYSGDEDQAADPAIAAAEGAEQAPAFRGIAYAMFEEMELADFGNRIPSLSFELVADDGQAVTIGAIAAELGGGAVAAGETAAVDGFAASGDSVRGAIEDLAGIVPMSLRDDGVRLWLQTAGGVALALARGQEAGLRELVRGAAAAVPREVSMAYYDAGRDFQTGLQRARTGAAAPDARVERRALPAVLTAARAKAIAEARLDALWAGRESGTVTLGWAGAAIRPGDVVTLDGEGGRWRVQRRVLGAMSVRLELVRLAAGSVTTAAGAATAASSGRAVAQVDLPHGPTMVRLFDLPLDEGVRDRPLLAAVAAGTLPGWRRAALSVSFDAGVGWTDIGASAAAGVLGQAVSLLAPGGAALFDGRSSVEVELLHDGMELQSRDEDALVGGANFALVGGELVQFGTVQQVGPRRYRLSGLLRGRRGTEHAAALHRVGEEFTLIDRESLVVVEVPAGLAAGAPVKLLASGVGDAQAAEAEVMISGEALRPPCPVQLRAAPVAGGTLLSWTRRSRAGWSWTSGADTPLGEETERYRVTLSAAGGARAVEVAGPQWLYGSAQRAADGAGPISVEVVQIGTHASSRPATILVP